MVSDPGEPASVFLRLVEIDGGPGGEPKVTFMVTDEDVVDTFVMYLGDEIEFHLNPEG